MALYFFRSPEMVWPHPASPLSAGAVTVVRKLLLVTAATALRPPVRMHARMGQVDKRLVGLQQQAGPQSGQLKASACTMPTQQIRQEGAQIQ